MPNNAYKKNKHVASVIIKRKREERESYPVKRGTRETVFKQKQKMENTHRVVLGFIRFGGQKMYDKIRMV